MCIQTTQGVDAALERGYRQEGEGALLNAAALVHAHVRIWPDSTTSAPPYGVGGVRAFEVLVYIGHFISWFPFELSASFSSFLSQCRLSIVTPSATAC